MVSDFPMKDVENPYIKLYSVNEALENGISLEDYVLNATTLNRDMPGVIKWAESEERFGEITIRRAKRDWYTLVLGEYSPTNLEYYSHLEWVYTEERAGKLIEYIRGHLEKAEELELWDIWLGSGAGKTEEVNKHHVSVNDLTAADLEELFNGRRYDCIAVKRQEVEY